MILIMIILRVIMSMISVVVLPVRMAIGMVIIFSP